MAMVKLKKPGGMIVSTRVTQPMILCTSLRGTLRPALYPRTNTHERGTALIMSLVILMILTILGITAMSTSSLEEKMSGNTQEGTRAFQVAESGLRKAMTDNSLFSEGASTSQQYPFNGRVTKVTSTYLQTTDPPRGSGNSTNYSAVHFQHESQVNAQVDSANIGLNTTITHGVVQIAPKH